MDNFFPSSENKTTRNSPFQETTGNYLTVNIVPSLASLREVLGLRPTANAASCNLCYTRCLTLLVSKIQEFLRERMSSWVSSMFSGRLVKHLFPSWTEMLCCVLFLFFTNWFHLPCLVQWISCSVMQSTVLLGIRFLPTYLGIYS